MLDFLLGLVGSGIDASYAQRQQDRQNAFNAEQAQINRDFQTSEREAAQAWDFEQWNRENDYNSPKSQLDRLLQAGINPNSAFQSMSNVAPGSVRTSPQSGAAASSVGMFNTNFGQAFQRYNESMLLNSQIRGQDESNRGLSITNDNLQRAYDADYDEKQESISNLKKLGVKYGIDIDIANIEEDIAQENYQFIRDSAKTRLDQLSQELLKTENEVKLGQEQLETEDLRQQDLRAGIDVKNAQARKERAQAEAEEFANEIFKTTGIRPSDGQTAVFARAYELTLEGKVDEGQHLLKNYYLYLGKVRDNSQFPSIDKVGTDILTPVVPELKKGVQKSVNYIFGTPHDTIRNPTWFKKNGSLRYWPTPFGLMPSPY